MKKIIFLFVFNAISFSYCSENNNSAYESLLNNSFTTYRDGNLKIEIDQTNKKIMVFHIDKDSKTEKEVYKTQSSEKWTAIQNTPNAILVKVEISNFWKKNTLIGVKINKSDGTVTTIVNANKGLAHSRKNYGTNNDKTEDL